MKKSKRILAVILSAVILFGTFAVSVSAGYNYGDIALYNDKYTKEISSTTLYGNYDYLNFEVNAKYDGVMFGIMIFTDKAMSNIAAAGYNIFNSGSYFWTPYINMKSLKNKTYYGVAFAADSSGENIDEDSIIVFTIKVNRTTAFSKQIVILKDNMKNTVNGPVINWHKLGGASKYLVYRRPYNSTKWTKLGTTTALTFTDKTLKAKSGEYVYTVKAQNKSGAASRFLYEGIRAEVVGAPVVKSVKLASGNTYTVTWSAVSGVKNYIIYRKANSGGWSQIGKVTNGATSFKDSGNKTSNVKYTYTVRAERSFDGYFVKSAYESGKSINFMKAPLVKSIAETSDDGIVVKWEAISGAKYDLYRKINGSGWVLIAKNLSSASYTDKSVKNNADEYMYTVRASKSGLRSHFIPSTTLKFIAAPVLVSAEQYVSGDIWGTKITWEAVAGAENYTLYSKPIDGSTGWTAVDELGADATWTVDEYNTSSKIYTVRSEGESYRGSYSAEGITYLEPVVEQ